MSTSPVDVAIIGAGPYGLALATHLRKRGIEHRIFGIPMHTWQNMPQSLNLKSLGFATSIPTALPHPTFPEYCRARGLEDYEPIEFATFASYGMSVQRHLVPYLEETLVAALDRADGQFMLTLQTGECVRARRVVVAVGLTYFQHMPEVLAELPPDLVSHTSQHSDYAAFADIDVAVVGAGASATEAATLLHEHGARVRVLARGSVKWGGRGPREWERSLLQRIRNPITVLGHGRDNWVLQHIPTLMHHLPAEKRLRITRAHLGPGGAWWLRDRAEGKFPIDEKTSILRATVSSGRVCLHLQQDGMGEREFRVDRVIAGTGYVVDVNRLAFISPEIAARIRRLESAPMLSRHFESSVNGLYFVGAAAAASFGPLVRFVAGSAFAVPVVAKHLASRTSPRRSRGEAHAAGARIGSSGQ